VSPRGRRGRLLPAGGKIIRMKKRQKKEVKGLRGDVRGEGFIWGIGKGMIPRGGRRGSHVSVTKRGSKFGERGARQGVRRTKCASTSGRARILKSRPELRGNMHESRTTVFLITAYAVRWSIATPKSERTLRLGYTKKKYLYCGDRKTR